MASKTNFKCNFCGKEIITKSINPEFLAWCKDYTKGNFTNDLMSDLKGPHICQTCVDEINEATPTT